MIEIEVRDYRGCKAAHLTLAPICLVAGGNAQGKSSAAEAAGAAAVGEVLPVAGVKKASVQLLITDGARSASVRLSDGEAASEIKWPETECRTIGSPPRCSPIAVGRDSLIEMDLKHRVDLIAELLKATPGRADLERELAETVPAASVASTWALIEAHGWDDAAARLKATGIGLKAKWEEVAGRRYGSAIATSWQPEGWDSSFIGATEETIRAHETAMLTRLTAISAKEAVSDARLAELEAKAGEEPERRAQLATAEDAARVAADTLAKAREERQGLPAAQSIPGCACPWCKKRIEVTPERLGEFKLTKAPEELTAEELKTRRQAIAYADGSLSKAVTEAAAATRAAAVASSALDAAIHAGTALAEAIRKTEDAGEWTPEEVERARLEHQAAHQRVAAFATWRRATELAEQVRANQVLLDALAADGLRQKKLGEALEVFNATHCRRLCEAAGWPPIVVAPSMALSYGGRDSRLVSESELYRVGVVLQLAVALLDRSAFVIIDGAEILEARHRNGLFALLLEAGIPALVCLTLSKRELAPDLAKAGCGQTLWMENGTAHPLAGKEAA